MKKILIQAIKVQSQLTILSPKYNRITLYWMIKSPLSPIKLQKLSQHKIKFHKIKENLYNLKKLKKISNQKKMKKCNNLKLKINKFKHKKLKNNK
jgi:hypothetical protein